MGAMSSDTAQPAQDAARITIAELTPGRDFTGLYACARKDRLTARTGSPYLALDLRDRSGTLPARLFADVDRIGARFERGDAIEVRGRVERFRGQLVAELEDARKLEPGAYDPSELLPTAYREPEELHGFLEHLIREVHDPGLRAVCEGLLLDGPVAEEFRRAPCTRAGHHAYLGGLIEHTVAVATLVSETCILHPRLDSDLLMAAALLHDIGKTREFTYGAEIALSDEGRALGHLQLGEEILLPALGGADGGSGAASGAAGGALTPERRTALRSAILCHHGTDPARLRQFPSPEAIALYRLNALDAQVKGALEHGINPARPS